MMKEKIYDVLKDRVAPMLLDNTVEKIMEITKCIVKSGKNIPDINDVRFTNNLPDFTLFKCNGIKYHTTRNEPRKCELTFDCEYCPIDKQLGEHVDCTHLDYGFEEDTNERED